MKRRIAFGLIASLCLMACGDRGGTQQQSSVNDRAVILAILTDFVHWKDATYGDLEGIVELDPTTLSRTNLTVEQLRRDSEGLLDKLGDDVLESFINRNSQGHQISELVPGPELAVIHTPSDEDPIPYLPQFFKERVKATGTLSLPGYSRDGKTAFLMFGHSWSIHGATVLYVLSMKGDLWTVTARHQKVFL